MNNEILIVIFIAITSIGILSFLNGFILRSARKSIDKDIDKMEKQYREIWGIDN